MNKLHFSHTVAGWRPPTYASYSTRFTTPTHMSTVRASQPDVCVALPTSPSPYLFSLGLKRCKVYAGAKALAYVSFTDHRTGDGFTVCDEGSEHTHTLLHTHTHTA